MNNDCSSPIKCVILMFIMVLNMQNSTSKTENRANLTGWGSVFVFVSWVIRVLKNILYSAKKYGCVFNFIGILLLYGGQN